ncbi:DNA-processing protein DprA [Leptospira idonii]|uniref:DNA-processing protein DprA n=1 Tax=Leptospira idonii TaxID=1193500 RepID=A0A4R9M1F9_9LEPT|nr:DNA-processing protein DprA [Leptospira idonii]
MSRICHKTGIWRKSFSLSELYEKLIPFLDRKWVFSLEQECSRFLDSREAKGLKFISIFDPAYPSLLKETFDPPLILAVRGSISVFQNKLISIVGTRKSSPISRLATRFLVARLSEEFSNLTIVSGMALGIDRESFLAALDLNIPVLGVLGTCLDQEYPPGNRDLYERVKREPNSSLISEFVFPTHPAKWTFPKRNRLIAGLSSHVYIMESGKRSGTLSTAMSALSENREIHVFDHILQYDNEGGKRLLEDGAGSISWESLSQNKGYFYHGNEEDGRISAKEWKLEEGKRRKWMYEKGAVPLGKGTYWMFNP